MIKKKIVYDISVQLSAIQYNLLAVALDHMWEHLDDQIGEGIDPEVMSDRIAELKIMQKEFEV